MTTPHPGQALPRWFIPAALLALAWNGFGAAQFARTALADEAAMVAAGMTPAQAALMAGLPVWMTLAFAVGVAGGLAGTALLLLRRRQAIPVLGTSLVGYVALFAGDALHGVFAAFGAPQVAVLALVVAIAAALVVMARRAARAGALA
ncbi:hypothetical protein [Roseomonas fluvialis]|uniref:Sugar transporter n=1 Tax=Roseomonas fluvialis TaxID=1750527 RepID=A0ABN6PAR5_9PROT|nr:hypothetical protein [Roseomonas fluvialis]BDG75042.1 hypothetical protein Rmf_49710 [Roseomonas fluvialis]